MEEKTNIREIIATLSDHTERILCKRRQELKDDEVVVKGVIDRLNSLNYVRNTGWPDKEEILNAYQKAREDRDEYKFQLNDCKNKIKELKEELEATRLNQTQHNISIAADLSQINERKSCVYARLEPGASNKNGAGGEPNTIHSASEETYKRELQYLHKTNEQFLEKIRKLESDLLSHEALKEKLNEYEGENMKLRKIAEEKEAKIMDMQIKFDEKFKNSKRDFTFQISMLNSKNLELEKQREILGIELAAAHEEIRLMKLSLKNPVKEAAEHGNCTEFADEAVTNSEQTEKEITLGKEELLNVNTQREKRGLLQSIENMPEHCTLTSLSEQSLTEEQQVMVDEAKELGLGVNRGTKRGQRGAKGSKKERVASQKQEAKKMKSSDETNDDPLQNIKNESVDTSTSNTRKGTRMRTVVNAKKKTVVSSKDAAVTNNKQNKKLAAKQGADENVEPCPLEYSRSSSNVNVTLEKIKLTEDTSTPIGKLLKKVQGDNNKRTNRRRNK
ncbi:centrosomal protein of 112 kDa-like isoform X1 [Schistocerca cancellata]|uniref:centrosomal protein of 112 kDa-like isoform X1 n=1 Tax=Schistocerca cancellata TaxID=274614 RepID=UPI002118A58D|nr:centrosomal protein of 112 kDa-like isoform X1 [Schistocerca cancellata]